MNMIDTTLKRSSRMLALMGVASIGFGIVVLAWPKLTLVALLALFGAFALVTGAFMVGAGLEHLAEHRTDWVPYVLGGLAGIAAGCFTFFRPGITGLVLLYLIAGWAIVTGAFEIAAAFDLWDETHESWLLGLAGVLSIAFGILIAVYPLSGALAIVWLIGAYAIAFGVIELVYAYRVHQAPTEARKVLTTIEQRRGTA
jgi:uncharacterized membrane protein HdeD (DUF308 family)